MDYEFLNGGSPLPANHKKAGQIGIKLTFPNGDPEQYVYGDDKDALLGKVLKMYGNTRSRVAELRTQTQQPQQQRQEPSAPAAAQPLSVEQRIQATNDLADPGKAGKSIVQLLKEETGFDAGAEAAKRAQEERVAARRATVQRFIDSHPDYHASPRNGRLLRDRVLAQYGTDANDQQWATAYQELQEMGVLESAPAADNSGARQPAEPSAPPQVRPSGTGSPRSTSGVPRPAGRSQLTAAEIHELAFSNPDEYARRLNEEPGFAAHVNKVLTA